MVKYCCRRKKAGVIQMTSTMMQQALDELVQCEANLQKAKERIKNIQSHCPHDWCFKEQSNNNNETEWVLTYKCCNCNLEERRIGKPVCETCHGKTSPMTTLDGRKPQLFQTALHIPDQGPDPLRIRGFRCNNARCDRITLLWVNGD